MIDLGDESLNDDISISNQLNVPSVFVDAVFEDLENQNLLKTRNVINEW